MFCLTDTENSVFVRYAKKFSMSTQIFFLSTRNWNALQNLECKNAGAGILVRKKKLLKSTRNTEHEEKMKERSHVSREGPAGTSAQLWKKILRAQASEKNTGSQSKTDWLRNTIS